MSRFSVVKDIINEEIKILFKNISISNNMQTVIDFLTISKTIFKESNFYFGFSKLILNTFFFLI